MYKLTKSIMINEETEYISYGIAYPHDNYIEVIAADISPDKEFVCSIIDKCNKFDAAPEHAADIIYDSLE